MSQYIPGQCNIGKFEARKRLNNGIFGMVMLSSFSFLFFVFSVPKIIVFPILFISGFIGILGLLQSYHKFCVYYGLLSVFNFENLVNLTKINLLDDQAKDKAKAFQIILYAIVLSLAYALLITICV